MRWRKHITTLESPGSQPGPERGVPGIEPSPSGLLGPHLTAPFFTPSFSPAPVGPALDIGLWRLIDEYDTVLDLNVHGT